MASAGQIIEQSRRTAVQFLLADLSMALTFLDVAKTTNSDETRWRNRQHARSAYDTVVRLTAGVSPSAEERAIFDARLIELKDRLLEHGYDVGPEAEKAA